ncbi:hypothetical protein [Winslowiella iniecta]|uniref:Uncharacterized protein n=1 Tax=Winslowiella iniecta TaxID=1560201 RepID=A0A0L7T6J5_9GAMM|nr:hypothetical protein [Winslowiella iniecta]KOC88735.1 hypothetical protein NG42_15055 [Winslowiella iniecta]KOC90970.1 hypothetical protein NG43_16245 [Winslowiella iniecta]
MNALLLLTGIARGALVRLTIQEWGYLLGVLFTLLRGLMIWRDKRAEQRKRTAIFQQLANRLDASTRRKAQKKLQQLDKEE